VGIPREALSINEDVEPAAALVMLPIVALVAASLLARYKFGITTLFIATVGLIAALIALTLVGIIRRLASRKLIIDPKCIELRLAFRRPIRLSLESVEEVYVQRDDIPRRGGYLYVRHRTGQVTFRVRAEKIHHLERCVAMIKATVNQRRPSLQPKTCN